MTYLTLLEREGNPIQEVHVLNYFDTEITFLLRYNPGKNRLFWKMAEWIMK